MSNVTTQQENRSVAAAAKHCFNQLPTDQGLGRSPLAHVTPPNAQVTRMTEAGVRFKERGLLGHFVLRCDPHNAQKQVTIAQLLGCELPLRPLTSAHQDDRVVSWLGPDEWLITLSLDQTFTLEKTFHERMDGHWALVDVSGGLTVYRLSGPHVVDVLKKSVPVDLHARCFPVGKVVTTVFAKASATLRRVDEDCFDVIVRRSFADYLWLWIQDASREFGLAVEP